ncbi:30S ribosomal protein S17e [Candidatus Pacearchaeota archaeon]|nr:30S ribosomal protein S17e [Candidatus Pacearchaeota archaeon]
MGRIKSKLVKRTSLALLKEPNTFNSEFENNKELLKGLTPSKKVRNQIAGYIVRKKRAELKGIKSIQ